jgi:hypothetical protein
MQLQHAHSLPAHHYASAAPSSYHNLYTSHSAAAPVGSAASTHSYHMHHDAAAEIKINRQPSKATSCEAGYHHQEMPFDGLGFFSPVQQHANVGQRSNANHVTHQGVDHAWVDTMCPFYMPGESEGERAQWPPPVALEMHRAAPLPCTLLLLPSMPRCSP